MPESRSRSHEIREALESEILTGEAGPGLRLDEQALARRFGVSRTPVREAIQALASAGLVEIAANRGAFVREVSIGELVQMFEVMAELEGMSARLAARRGTEAALSRLDAALAACGKAAEAGGPDEYYAANARFHEAIFEASGNAFLAGEAKRLQQRLMAYRRIQLRVPERIGQSLAEHRAVVEAIRARDPETAEERLRAHVTIQGTRFADFVALLGEARAAE